MTDQEYDERLGAIEELALRFPGTELTEQNVKGYVWSLSDLNQIALRAAIERCVNTSKFFPTVAEIRENASAVVIEGKGIGHPASCLCWGSGFVQMKVDGYNQARPCGGAEIDSDTDGDDSDIDRNW